MDEAGKRYKALTRRRMRARKKAEDDGTRSGSAATPVGDRKAADSGRQFPWDDYPRLATLADFWPGARA